MSKGWIICTPEYQYNDEVYYTEGDGVVIQSVVFTDQKEAVKALGIELEKFWRESCELNQYCYSIDEIVSDTDEAISELAKVGIELDSDETILSLPKEKLTQEQLDCLARYISLSKPYLQEVTVE